MNQNDLPSEYNEASNAPSSAKGFGFPAVARKIINRVLGMVYTRQMPCNFYSSGFVVDTTVKTLVGPSKKRRYLAIQNNGAVGIFIAFGATPSINGVNSFAVGAGAVFTFESGYIAQNELNAVAAAACNVAIIEGVEIDFETTIAR